MLSDLNPSESWAANSISQVDGNIFISGYLAAADPGVIRGNGITRIVKMFADDTSYPGGWHRHPNVRYHVVAAEDVADYDIRREVSSAIRFILAGVQNGERILIHCHMGISRSSTIVLMYLMINRGYTLDQALRHLRGIRSIVNPNPGFMRELRSVDAAMRRIRARRLASVAPSRPIQAAVVDQDIDTSLAIRMGRDTEFGSRGRDKRPLPRADDVPAPEPVAGPWKFRANPDE